jgi:(E)-4-hydroxy-3-methylbut-2-enyl-diphosphate synthase
MVAEYGDTPRGMVASAMELLRECRSRGFDQVVVSMKSSNTRVMVHAYRLLAAEMVREGMDFPIHLGVTEAGNGAEGRIKSAVGIGALLADGIGDTVRVSLTEPPENEIPAAITLTEYFTGRETTDSPDRKREQDIPFDPYEYSRRATRAVGRLGGSNLPLLYSELNEEEKQALDNGAVAVLTAGGSNPVGEWRRMIIEMNAAGDRRPVILHRRYAETSPETLTIKAAADFGVMFIDGLADGIYIENEPQDADIATPLHPAVPEDAAANCGRAISQGFIDSLSLGILQASRARMSKADYIACPGCGRTLFDLHGVLDEIKSRTSHLTGLKIAVMGCIVNGPGEMADADYGYVGAAPGHITLYRGKDPVRRNIPQEEALDALLELLKADGDS